MVESTLTGNAHTSVRTLLSLSPADGILVGLSATADNAKMTAPTAIRKTAVRHLKMRLLRRKGARLTEFLRNRVVISPMRISNPDRLSVGINRWDTARTPTGFAEIVGDDFPLLHGLCFFCSPHSNDQVIWTGPMTRATAYAGASRIILKFNRRRYNRQNAPRIPILTGSNAGPPQDSSNLSGDFCKFQPTNLREKQ
jgi:hypothetical protein